jgi:hypothetical protein
LVNKITEQATVDFCAIKRRTICITEDNVYVPFVVFPIPAPLFSFMICLRICSSLIFLNTSNTMDTTSGTDRSYIPTGWFSVFKSGLCFSIFSFYVKLCEQCFSFLPFLPFLYIYTSKKLPLLLCKVNYSRFIISPTEDDSVSIYINL